MRVLMICPELPAAETPGSMAPTARQIRSLQTAGIDTDVVDMSGVPKLKYLMVIPKIRRLIDRCDLIHAHFGYCGWLAKLAPLGKFASKPVVMSYMGDDLLGTRKNEQGELEWFSRVMVAANRRLAKRVTEVIVKSQEMAALVAPVPASVIPNGVDTSVFAPQDRQHAREQLGLPKDQRLVLFPGNPEYACKGYPFAANVCQRASELLGTPIRLIPLWNIDPDEVAVYMNACDAMVMTSLSEGSPNVVKEALACNVAIAGVPVGDVEEQLANVSGCHCLPRETEPFANGLIDLLRHHPRSAGREAIESRQLDLPSVAERIIQVYRRALQLPTLPAREPQLPSSTLNQVG